MAPPRSRLRTRSCLVFVLLAACANTYESNAPEAAQDARTVVIHDAETFFQTTSFSGASFSHDNALLLMSSDATGVYNAHVIAINGGDPVQLTSSETDATFAVSMFPNDDRFLTAADSGGNERTHLFVQHAGGRPLDLTPGEETKAAFAGWREDDAAFFVLSNARDPRFFDLFRYDVPATGTADYPREMIFENPSGYSIAAITRDGRWLALNHTRNNADSDVYVVDLQSEPRELVHVTPHSGNISHGVATFTPDGSQLYYSSNEDSEFTRIWAYDLANAEREVVLEADWDVQGVSFSRSGRYRVTAVNADARTEVTILDLKSGEPLVIPDLPDGDLRGVTFSSDETRIAFYLNSDTSPSNLFVLDLGDGNLRQLTDALNPAIDPSDLVESEIIRYPSFDELEIPALLYRPHQASASAKVPALVWVHGGPGGQCRTGYNPMIQHLVNNGYAVLAVNNRGSSGYGKTFFHLDDRKHGTVDLSDCIYGRRYLEGLDWVDGDKVGIIGGSYGGYMVVAALAFEPEAFDIGIDIFGVTNWLRTLQSIPPWWEDFREALFSEMGDPETDEERLRANSPLFHAGNIVRPLLVVQGANDPRVLQVESDEMVEAVRANGVPVEYVLFPDEGHGFRSRENRIQASEAFVRFADRHLLEAASEIDIQRP